MLPIPDKIIYSVRLSRTPCIAASRLARTGADIYSIAALLNHAQPRTTHRYCQHSVDNLRRVGELPAKRDGTCN